MHLDLYKVSKSSCHWHNKPAKSILTQFPGLTYFFLYFQVEESIQNDEKKLQLENIINKTINLNVTNEEEPPVLVIAVNVEESSKQVNEELDDINVQDLDRNSQKYRLAMIEKSLSDVRTMRSYTSASTIAPEVSY